jgi:hypothetical protein
MSGNFLLKIQLSNAYDILTPRFQSQETNVYFLGISCR